MRWPKGCCIEPAVGKLRKKAQGVEDLKGEQEIKDEGDECQA